MRYASIFVLVVSTAVVAVEPEPQELKVLDLNDQVERQVTVDLQGSEKIHEGQRGHRGELTNAVRLREQVLRFLRGGSRLECHRV